MEKKIVSLREVKWEKQYEAFYKNPIYSNLSREVFFKHDIVTKKDTKIS